MATTLLVSDSYDPRSHLYDEDPESQASYQGSVTTGGFSPAPLED